jgi:hypothetical protein
MLYNNIKVSIKAYQLHIDFLKITVTKESRDQDIKDLEASIADELAKEKRVRVLKALTQALNTIKKMEVLV